MIEGGKASQVRYAGFAAGPRGAQGLPRLALEGDASGIRRLVASRSSMAFLINAYNAFTVEKILTRYPNISRSGISASVFGNPLKDRSSLRCSAQPLLARRASSTRRCASTALRRPARALRRRTAPSIGCPMLREEAYRRRAPRGAARGTDAPLPLRPLAQPLQRGRRAPRGIEDLRLVQGGLRAAATAGSTVGAGVRWREHADLLADAPADRERARDRRRLEDRVPRLRLER